MLSRPLSVLFSEGAVSEVMREVLQKLPPQGRPTRDSTAFFFHPGFVFFFPFSFPSFSGYFRVLENSTFLHQKHPFLQFEMYISTLSGHTANKHGGVKSSSVQDPGTVVGNSQKSVFNRHSQKFLTAPSLAR